MISKATFGKMRDHIVAGLGLSKSGYRVSLQKITKAGYIEAIGYGTRRKYKAK